MSRLLSGSLLCAALLMLSGVGTASAQSGSLTGFFFNDSGSEREFTLGGSNGYTVEVSVTGNEATLSASKEFGSVAYRVPVHFSAAGFSADFGKLGRMHVEFRPSGRTRTETPPSRCEGRPRVIRWGAFIGRISFNGERGYTRVRATRAAGFVRHSPSWKCRRHQGTRRRGSARSRGPSSGTGESSEGPVVFSEEDPRRKLSMEAFAFSSPQGFEQALFLVELSEARRRMSITRSIFQPAGVGTFSVDESLSTATLSPSDPFSGSATFQRLPDGSVSWTGSLAVTLPGTARLLLVGPRFHPRLYRQGEEGTGHATVAIAEYPPAVPVS